MLSDNTKRRKRQTPPTTKENTLLPQTTKATTTHSSMSTKGSTLTRPILVIACILAIAFFYTITTSSSSSSSVSKPRIHKIKTAKKEKISTSKKQNNSPQYLKSSAIAPPPKSSPSQNDFKGRTIQVNPHLLMPALGFGTCCRPSAKGDQIYHSALLYLQHGGRLIDTAMAYGNHVEIGRAVKDSNLPREDIWITSKISVGRVRGEETLDAIDGILEELDVDYLDLLLIHTPKRGKEESIKYWKGMIQAQKKGKTRAIGVSNFNQREILDLYEATNVMPALNQIQFHPWTPKEWKNQVAWQKRNDIQTTAYTSLGGVRFDNDNANYSPTLASIAKKHGVSMIHVMLQWALQQGVAVIPGATSEKHIRENLSVPNDFRLTEEDMVALEESEPPEGWFDAKRGPNKSLGEEAGDEKAWTGDHSIAKAKKKKKGH